ncbi:MAG: hypothetical protein ACLQVX_19135 [Limisphaerales bacterium]
MNKLSKEKRNQLLLVAGLTVLVLAGLWAILIAPLRQKVRDVAGRKAAVARKLDQVTQAIKNADRVAAELGEAQSVLAELEARMGSGDLYSWAIDTLRRFKVSYRVDIPQFSQIDGPHEVSLLAQFPYKQATVTIGGSAFFYDFGQFLADFENRYPFVRVLNLSLEPIPSLGAVEQEKLAFKMDVVFLVKPGDA